MSSSDWTFGQRMAAGFTVAAVALATLAVFGHRNSVQLIDNDQRMDHSQQVRRSITDLLSTLQDVETGQRGYTITGEESFLEPYTRGRASYESDYLQLRQLTQDNADQQHHLDELRPVMDGKLGWTHEVVELRRQKGFEPASRQAKRGQGKEFMDKIRTILAAMDHIEAGLLVQRAADSQASARAAQAVMLWGGILGVLFIGALGVFMTKTLSHQIIGAVGHIQSSSSELQAAANQQATGSREHAALMTKISTTISELMATSRQIAESAQRVAHISGETAQAAGKGDQTVQRAKEAVSAIRKQVDLIVGHMLDLGKKSQQIGGVLEIINELAEQTNILSINASVEAAGAGEAGRRFAVVADEIRKLAERVGGSTKEIRGLVEEVRAAVNTTVMATEGGAKAAEAGTRQFGEMAAAFQGIVLLVGTSSDAAREIELSTKQQATAVEQVNVAILNVAQATRETEASSNQTLQTAVELTHLSKDLARLVQAEAKA